jgi:YD repeat-containing protein
MFTLHRNHFSTRFLTLALLTGCFLLGTVAVHAQYTQTARDGHTPPNLEQGAPAGAFALSGFEHINHYNGSLSVALPLLQMGGRGSAGVGMRLKIAEQVGIYRYYDWQSTNGTDLTWSAGDGWRVGYGPGVLLGKYATNHPQDGTPLDCGQYVPDYEYNTRLTFTTWDGTEIQLHDKQHNGSLYARHPCTVPPSTPMRNRGKVFVSPDGESTTFISDSDIFDNLITDPSQDFFPSGYLLLSDGSRYRIDSGKISWMRDRNGNKTSFTYQILYGGSSWRMLTATDSLNRQVTVTYNDNIGTYDEITYKGVGGATRSIKVWHHWMHDALRPDFTIQQANQLFPEVYDGWNIWTGDWAFDMAVVSKVELPDGRTYRFYYNSLGEVARIILPTGGGMDYTHSPVYQYANGTYANSLDLTVMRRVTQRTTYNTLTPTTLPSSPPTGTVERIEKFLKEGTWSGQAIIRIESRAPDNTLLAQSKIYHNGTGVDSALFPTRAADYASWSVSKEYKSEAFNVVNGVAGSLLRSTDTTWGPASNCNCPAPNPHIEQIVTTLVDSNQVAKQTFTYDQYNNRTDTYEYDYGTGTAGALVRRTHTDYLTSGYDVVVGGNYTPNLGATIHIRNLPSRTQVYDAVNAVKAETLFEYDDYSASAHHAALVNRTNISGLGRGLHDQLHPARQCHQSQPLAQHRWRLPPYLCAL